ncbi:DUF3857 domain-containing protein [Flammeovirga kamogawensis]|uniref:DUF3857 domain-containing protein n=1 Tax=Flammeovirga kamogawensis TaxID=373891 RepID=A0ABX8H245_9BACT|nr:DUF3857 domain-containing protein [Flammeovirga kamogawensis]MBB6462608.1 hypothetical protein [Flammeovirga kamogawensis]QWG09647.1 DUF3857 domain-containing protein [Flammeovirga kamogawensis]TRX65161.1 DUF3857 domain-containing protein [Flammeovirga kamogawensis]
MKLNYIILITLMFLASNTFAQTLYHEKYSWKTSPKITEISEKNKEYEAVVISDNYFIECNIPFNGQPITYSTNHKIVHINSDVGIEKYNKVYIPIQGNSTIINLQVRSIGVDGNVTTIQKDNIKELKNVKGISNVKIFAIEGLEVGGEAEYLYTLKAPITPLGSKTIQSDVPVLEANIRLIYPKQWTFETKSYNKLASAKISQNSTSKKTTYLKQLNIPAFQEEEYAYNSSKMMRFDYKLVNNGYKKNLFSWYYITNNIVESFSSPKTAKVANKFVKEIAKSNLSDEEKIIAVENKIKSTIRLEKGSGDNFTNPKNIIANGYGNLRGIYKLYIYCFAALDIKNQLVFGSSRYDGFIDEDFATFSSINDIFFYFPKSHKYLLPESYHMRYGTVHQGLIDTNAVFISYYVEFGKLKRQLDSFKKINGLAAEFNNVGVIASINFDENLSLPKVILEDYAQGYRAFSYRSVMQSGGSGIQEKFAKDVILSAFENFEVEKIEFEGVDMKLSTDLDNYFRMKMEFTSPELVEKAGNEYLISVGKIIGKQSELYQEKERQQDIVMSTITKYHHEITINIPKGYKLEGLENIKEEHAVNLEGEKAAYFVSDYTQSPSSITITVDEVYETIFFPKSSYQYFRNVINAASNFNKLTLVLIKDQKEL